VLGTLARLFHPRHHGGDISWPLDGNAVADFCDPSGNGGLGHPLGPALPGVARRMAGEASK